MTKPIAILATLCTLLMAGCASQQSIVDSMEPDALHVASGGAPSSSTVPLPKAKS